MYAKKAKQESNKGEMLYKNGTSKFYDGAGSLMTKASNVKSWVYNSNLKYAINDLRHQLQWEAKNTNPAMKQKIIEWVARDYTEAANNMTTKETPLAQENEAMRQLLSDLINGPLASLLNNDARKKLCKLSTPLLPTSGTMFFEESNVEDKFTFPFRSRPAYQTPKISYPIDTAEKGYWDNYSQESIHNVHFEKREAATIMTKRCSKDNLYRGKENKIEDASEAKILDNQRKEKY